LAAVACARPTPHKRVVDCVAHQSTVEAGIHMVLKGGTVVVVGGARCPVTIDLPVVQEYQVRLQGSATYRWEDFDQTIEIIAGVDAARFVTATFPIERAAEEFAAMSSGNEMKILVVGDSRDD